MFPNLDGYKTYLAAAGLFGLALYQFSQGDLQAAIQSFLAGLAALGLRHAIGRTSLIGCVLLMASSVPLQAQEVSKAVLDRIRQVSVSVEVAGAFSGSGTLFDKDNETWCLTAQHVVNGCKSKLVRVTQCQQGKEISLYAEVFKQDEQRDVALLKLGKGVFGPGVQFYKGKKPGLDTAVVHCGSMNGHHHTVTRGYLIGYDQTFQRGLLRDLGDFTGYYGSSGGGVFNTQGQYLGMVVGGIEARLVYIVPVRSIEEVLK